MGLTEYRKKRNFQKTREPAGGKSPSDRHSPIFVVQEHWASHHHYDFRLEAFGTLKSWAVPKGPPTEVGEKRLAVEVEDHPIPYAKFKGRIPEGEYGAGVVKIWDHGFWTPPDHVREALQRGHLEFELKGRKLRGRWLLQRTRALTGRKPQWLLIKRSDPRLAPTQRRVQKALKSPDGKKGSDPWPEAIVPQLALLVDKVPQGADWIHEVKFDGYRTIGKIRNGQVELLTRNGLDWTERYPSVQEELQSLKVKSAIFDGEIVVFDKKGVSTFSLLQEALTEQRHEALVYMIFDLLYLNGRDLRGEPLEIRKQILKKLLRTAKLSNLLYSEHTRGQGSELFLSACRSGREGIVAKERHQIYQSGRGSSWQKIKCSRRQEFIIAGYTEPEGQRKNFGALLMGAYEGDKLRYVGKVGTGFGSGTLEMLLQKFQRYASQSSPLDIAAPPSSRKVHWLKPRLVAEIEFKTWTGDRKLRQAAFIGLREDKKAREVVIEKPVEMRKAPPSTKEKSPVGDFRITHPDRVLFEKSQTTKMDVANYYRSVGPWILPHLKNRPLSFLRCTSHADASCFFQKHISNDQIPDVLEDSIQDQKVNFIKNEEGLLQLVQWGVLELHAWQCHMQHPSHPDQLVFDLDPAEGLEWGHVVEAALQTKDVLEHFSLRSFLKTTGGKGLHLHVPIRPQYSWEQGKAFAKSVAQILEEQSPTLYTTNILKKKRVGKIFIDYLRNGMGATAIAPYSLRAKTQPVVAVPIEWSELRKISGPQAFDLQTTLKRLAHQKKDPWADFSKVSQRIKFFKD